MAVILVSDHKPSPKVISVTIGLKETFFKVSETTQTFYSNTKQANTKC